MQIERTYDRRGVFNENHVDCPNDYLVSHISIPRKIPMSSLNSPNGFDTQYKFQELRDGPYGFSPLIGRYCGNSLPREDIRATSGLFFVVVIPNTFRIGLELWPRIEELC